ncbi:MAG: class I SAM-dependent methyltransferase [Sulfurimonas denitrificans]|nr:class I SAM-dependent methyltransferase [Sulfurimonas denitrificans]
MVNQEFKKVLDNGWSLSDETFNNLTDAEKDFLLFELGDKKTSYYNTKLPPKNIQYYKNRLEAINFTNYEVVLDAACGIGQWSYALSLLNNKVIATDYSTGRIETAKELNKARENVDISHGNIELLEQVADSSIDAVFCYGAFMFTNTDKTIKEFHRVLKPNGKMYLNYNGYGVYVHQIIKSIFTMNKALYLGAYYMIKNSLLNNKKANIFTKKGITKLLEENDFSLKEHNDEGTININNTKNVIPTYKKSYFLFSYVLELIATKKESI